MIGPYLTDTITLKQFNGTDRFQSKNPTTDISLRARVDYKNRQAIDDSGEQVISRAKISLRNRTILRTGFSARGTGYIAYEDLVIFDGVDHAIIQIVKKKDFSTKYIEIWVA